ncbi:MAG: hypothetical protein ACYDHP_13100 [Ferrimicrobium sp.]
MTVGEFGWLVVILAVAGLSLLAWRRPAALVSLSGLWRLLRSNWVGRSAMVGMWAWLGWHLFVR